MKNNFKAIFFSEGKALLIFSIISGILILSWFRYGHIYGGGDVGLQTYNPQRILENARYVWWDSAGPGTPLPQGLSAIPFQFMLFLLQTIGFSPLALQATLFFLLLTSMGFGMYLFTSAYLTNQKKYSFIAGIFYMFNPYMMIQVWHRFIHTTILFAAALPFFAIFWSKWVNRGLIKYLVLFLVTNFLFVYVFGTFAFIITLWIFLLLLTIPAVIPWQGKKHFFTVGLRFCFGFLIWIFINSWWLIPVTQISPAVLSEQHKTEESLMTLVTISAQEILPYSLQLVNPFYLFYQAELGTIYKNILFQMIPWVFVSIILFGLINSIRQKSFSMFGIFYLLALFLAKGAAPPFGNIYIFGFSNIFILGVLRNPFEKTGLILVFFSTAMFILGLKVLSEKLIKNIWFSRLSIVFIISLILIFSWPMLLGKVIGRFDKPAFVEVPLYYKEADNWLQEQKRLGISDGKILHLPLTKEESIRYKWKFGYNGLEPSDTFFTAFPSISRGFNIFRIDDALNELSSSFQEEYTNSGLILDYLQDYNIRFIVLHKDVDWMGSDLVNPLDLEKILDKLEYLNEKNKFGDLVVYKLEDQYFKQKITLENDVNLIYPGEEKLSIWPYVVKNSTSKLISPQNFEEDFGDIEINKQLVFPKSAFIYGNSSESAFPLERLARMKPFFQQTGMIESLSLANKIIALTETLSSISKDSSLSNISNILENYEKQMKKLLPNEIQINKFMILGQESLLSSIFRAHLAFLQSLQLNLSGDEQQKTQQIATELENHLINLNIVPKYNNLIADEIQVFKFNLPVNGDYELVIMDIPSISLYPGDLNQVNFFIDGKPMLLNSKKDENYLTFGTLDYEKGLVEISFPQMLSKNLASLEKNGLNTNDIEILINEVKPLSTYRFSTFVKIEGGGGFNVSFYENQNPQPSSKEFLQLDPSAGWQKLQMNFQTKLNTKSVKILISSEKSNFALQPKIYPQEIKVQRLLTNPIALIRKEKNFALANQEGYVHFTKISPVSYEGKIEIVNAGFLFFKETFHPDWQLTIKNIEGTESIKRHYLGNLYANAWYIDKAGEYDFKITFKPQNTFSIGILLSILGILGTAGYSILVKKMKK